MTELKIEEIFQKSLAVAFYNALEKEPAVVSLIFRRPNEGEEAYDFLKNNLTKDEICLVLKPVDSEKINLSFIDKKNSKVYNIKNITYQEPNFNGFLKSDKDKYAIFLTMFVANGQEIVSSECQSPMMINEIIFEKSDE